MNPDSFLVGTPATPQRGMLVVIEGIDGAGKSTQSLRLGRECDAMGVKCVSSREPTRGKYGRRLREAAGGGMSIEEELECFMLDRAEHVSQVVSPALAAGEVVVLDRYYYSTVAYQGARGYDPAELLARNERFAPIPDLLILIDVPCELGLHRVCASRGHTDQFENLALLTKAREIFLRLEHPNLRVIDGTLPPDEVWEHIREAFRQTVTALGFTGVSSAGFMRGNEDEVSSSTVVGKK